MAQTTQPMKIPTSSPVMVTGSTGYVGGVLVQQLLEAGLTVHCPVRDPTNPSKTKHLRDLPRGETIKFFKANLLEKGSYAESIKGCSVVFHVASPFSLRVSPDKVQEQLLDPAINGSLNVLESASLESSVQRVVLTSSVVSIATDGTECQEVRKRTGKMVNEENWNQSASVDYDPYAYSKTLAEQASWEYVKKTNCGYELVVCNPGFIMGPGVKCHGSSESFTFVQNYGSGFLASGVPDLRFAFVDVRDVARGHIAAGFLPSETVANQRYILVGTNSDMLQVAKILSEAYPDYMSLIPTRTIPKWLFWCVAPFIGKTRQYVSRAVGTQNEMDNSKSLRDLQLGEYRSLKETMVDMFQQGVDSGYIPPAPKRKGGSKSSMGPACMVMILACFMYAFV